MSKLYRINLNISKDGIAPQAFINREKQLEGGGFGEYSPAQFTTNILLNGITAGHPKGNIQSIRRTLKIKDLLEAACENGGVAELSDEDYKYLKSSFSKADGWNNTVDSAVIIDRVFTTLEKAEEVK